MTVVVGSQCLLIYISSTLPDMSRRTVWDDSSVDCFESSRGLNELSICFNYLGPLRSRRRPGRLRSLLSSLQCVTQTSVNCQKWVNCEQLIFFSTCSIKLTHKKETVFDPRHVRRCNTRSRRRKQGELSRNSQRVMEHDRSVRFATSGETPNP